MQNKVHDDKPMCGAKTRAGTPCQQPAGWGTNHVGTGRCKLHGGKSTGPSKAKAKRNKNAVTTGEHEVIWIDTLDQEEKELLTKIDTRELEQTENEIKLTDIRLRRMMQRIQRLQEEAEDMQLEEVAIGIDKGMEVNMQKYQDKLSKIQNIEDAITRIQANKRLLIETKSKLKTELDISSTKIEKEKLQVEKLKKEVDLDTDKPIEITIVPKKDRVGDT